MGHKRKALYSAAMVLLLLGGLFGFIKPGAATPEAGSFWVATYQAESGSIASITYGSSGAVLVGSIAGAGVESSNAWIAKISDDGSLVWQKAAVGGQVLSDVEINGTNYVAVGRYNNTNAWIVKFDENGNVVWQKAIGGAEDTQAVAVSGNSFVGSYNGRPWIVIFDENGSVVWEKTLNGDGNYSFADVVMDVYKGYKYYYVVGWTNGTNVTQNDAWIVKFRGDGKVVYWQKGIAGSGDEKATSAIMIPGGVLVSIVTDNGTILAKFHYFGNFTWAKFYPDVRINKLINTGYDVVAVGELSGKGFAMRTDYNGSVIKAVTYETDEMGVFNAVAFDANTNATLIGGRLDGQAFAIRAPLEDLTVPSCGIVKDVAITPEDVNLTIVDTSLTLGNVNSTVVDTSVDFVETTARFTKYMPPKLVASVADVVGDDYGPGTYTYPTNPVFNQTGLFDITGTEIYETASDYVLKVHFANLGGNPWGGWNGFSLQIVEAYFDFKEGGNTSAIKLAENGPGANVDLDRPWDVAVRVTGWTSKLVLPNMSTINIEASADTETNVITIKIPKEYLNVTPDTYFAVIAGSQDGFGIDDWRSVEVQAAEWRIGGGDPDAIIAGVAPRVMDLLAPAGFKPTQEEQLQSYNTEAETRATVVMLPISEFMPGIYKEIASVADVVGDDYGPGTYTYPTNPVFNQTGLFDIIGVTLYEGSNEYILQVHFANLGGNPWGGWNGFSLQIVEAYFDFKDGGNTTAIKLAENGPGANVNLDRPWDVAIRVTGWTSKLVLPNMSTIDINATANLTTNTIIITIPKEYLNVTPDTYFAVIAGSQDGFGIDDWRSVEVQAAEWRIGGGDADAIIAGVAPRVMDLLAPAGFRPTQEEQLTSYNASETNPERATIVMIPLIPTPGGGGETPTTTTNTTATSTETTTPTTTTTAPTSTPVTVTKTVTKTETMTKTVTDTMTETFTHTTTKTETKTETMTKTETTTKTETKTETTGGGGICGPATIIGLTAVPLLLRKRR